MKKFTQWVDVIREAEERKQSELQKSYKEYFSAKLNKFGAKSPADLTAEQKAEFFNEIKKDWEKGQGAKPSGQKDVEEHGVKESEEFEMNEGVFYRIPRKMIQDDLWMTTKNLQNFFNHASAGADIDPGVLDSVIKSLQKIRKEAKKFTDVEEVKGTIYEAEEVNESALEIAGGVILGLVGLKVIAGLAKGIFGTIALKRMTDPEKLKELVDQIVNKAKDKGVNPLKIALWRTGVLSAIDNGKIENGFELLKVSDINKMDLKGIFESEGFDMSDDVNEANISMYKSMVQNALKDLGVEVKQSDIKVGTKKSDSWSFVTLNGHVLCSDTAYDQMVAWAKAAIKEDPAKYGLPASLKESEVFEAEVKNAEDFKEYAMAILKKQHGDDFDEAKAEEIVKGLSDEAEKDGDWGAAVGKLQNS